MNNIETRIGKIRAVSGTKIVLALDPEVDVAPVIRSRIQRITQVGSLLKIKVGSRFIIGSVASAVAISHNDISSEEGGQKFAWGILPGEKSLELNAFGEIIGGRFERGVSSFPDINSEVHVISEEDLKCVYSNEGKDILPISIGELSGGISLPAIIDLQKFVMRHSAIVGSTGAGKSNAVSLLLDRVADQNWGSTKIIIADIHGEYASPLKGKSDVFSLRSETSPFKLPYWLLPFEEMISFFMGRKIQLEDLGVRNLKEEITKHKVKWAEDNGLKDFKNTITVDSPIPFDIRQIWYDFYVLEFATYEEKEREEKDISWVEKGDAKTLTPPIFKPPGNGSKAPFKAAQSLGVGSLLEKIRTRCIDKNYSFIMGDDENDVLEISIEQILKDWLDGSAITILDLNNVPSDIIDITVASISRLLFDISRWGRDLKGFGRNRPLLLVFDEAHLYLSDDKYGFSTGASVRTVTRILREGRKYGVGTLIVSQRPSDINSTILSQIGTIVSLRLNNSSDIGVVKGAVPDNLANMADVIGSLKTGEAFVSGEAVPLPIRAQFDELKGRTHSSDPKLITTWSLDKNLGLLDEVIKIWRVQGATKKIQGEK